MESLNNLLETEVWNGQTLGHFLTFEFLLGFTTSVVTAIFILIAGYMVGGWIRKRLQRLSAKYKHLDDTLFNFLGNVSRYVIILFSVLFILNTFGIQTTSFIAIIGAAGLAIGLALQGTLSNVAAGVMIIFFRPIKLGDVVNVNGKLGTVKDITLNFTELASLDNIHIVIPNSEVWGNTIENYSVYQTRRVEWVFGVSYDSNLKTAEEAIRTTILNDPRAHTTPEPFIQVHALNDSSVDFLVRVWCNSSDFFAFKTDMTRAVKEAFDENGIAIPFPTRTYVKSSE